MGWGSRPPLEPTLLSGLAASARRILQLAWPAFIGQSAVLAFAIIDTLLVARASPTDLAALAVGSAAYITVFIGLMGVVIALAPIVGQLYGAGRVQEAGRQVHQAVWLAIGLSIIGSTLLALPYPFLALARAGPELGAKVQGYLLALAFSLPASLLFTVYRGFNTAISRPKAVMKLQLAGLAIKIPLSTALVFGWPAVGLPALGVVGCGIATAVAMWSQALAALWMLRRDASYAPFELLGRGLDRPQWPALKEQLRLGIPMGASIMVEVTGFAFMAIFIARLGTTPVAAHQLAVNVVSVLFMLPLAFGNATSTLVAQRIGAADPIDARRLAWHGLTLACVVALVLGSAVFALRAQVLGLYTSDAAILAAALPLVAWLTVFHLADALQIMAAFVLRAYKIVTVPMCIYVAALWGVGLGGGYLLAFNVSGNVPAWLQGARGYWAASTTGLLLAGVALTALLAWVLNKSASQERRSRD